MGCLMDKHRIIQQLRAKADSTTFPEEANALRARADKLEAKYGPAKKSEQIYVPLGFPPPRPRGGNVSPDYQKVMDDMMAWRNRSAEPHFHFWQSQASGEQPPPTMNINDLNEMMKSMSFGRPIRNGIMIINGNVFRVDGIDNFPGATG